MIVLCNKYEGRYASLFCVQKGKVKEVAYATGQLAWAMEHCHGTTVYRKKLVTQQWDIRVGLRDFERISETQVPKEIQLYLMLKGE